MTTQSDLEACFVSYLPSIQRIARTHFRHLDPDRRDEAVQNTLALCWKFYVALFHQGRANQGILKSILWYAIKQTKSGRSVQGKARSKDALDYRDRGRVSFEIYDLNGFVGRTTPVPDQVSFRVDVPAFFGTLNERQQNMAFDLAAGDTTGEVAQKHGITSGAVSQFRRRFKVLFDEFFDE